MAVKNADLFGRYVWLIDTIRSHGRITFAEISERWKNCRLSYGDPLPWRTFMNHKKAIADVFNIYINVSSMNYKYL